MKEDAALFKALGDETRLAMVALLLRHGELCVCELEHTLRVTQSKASRHLRYLKSAGLLEDRRGAQWVYYRVGRPASPAHKAILTMLRRILQGEAHDDLDRRLERFRVGRATAGEACRGSAPSRSGANT